MLSCWSVITCAAMRQHVLANVAVARKCMLDGLIIVWKIELVAIFILI